MASVRNAFKSSPLIHRCESIKKPSGSDKNEESMSKKLNEYEAAAMLSISPELLKYCTSYSVKTGEKRKLIATKDARGLFSFDTDELSSYDNYLREEWPAKAPGDRPHLPDEFKNEIRREASGECALCLANSNSCEAAHIAAVHKSKCNHPHNLIWLCANHHTKFDKGLIGPKEEQNELVKAAKTVMRERRRIAWLGAGDVTNALGTLLNLAAQANAMHKKAAAQDKKIALELAQSILNLLPDVLKLNSQEKLQPVLAKVQAHIDAAPTPSPTNDSSLQVLDEVGSLEAEFVHEAGLKCCPLCQGTRWHRDSDCPVCQGDGTVPQDYTFKSWLFEPKACQLCSGHGRRVSSECPVCGGQGVLDFHVWDRIDWSMYDMVSCQLCKGSGRRNLDDCPACGGEGEMEARFADATDWAGFLNVKCRLCAGTGRDDRGDCPVCGGDGEIEERVDQNIDWQGYKMVLCRLCDGSGRNDDDECRACHGDREMYARDADNIDWAQFSDSKCPLCKGSGRYDDQICPECHGAGRMESWRAEAVDLSIYQSDD